MKPQVKVQSLPNGCIYPFEGLSPEQGYPSIADFIVKSGRGAKGRGVVALRHYQRITRMCRVSGQLVHTPNCTASSWRWVFTSMTHTSVDDCATLASPTFSST